MIRLWGGGQYEAEVFYDYCDENGLMIWHDFMFAVGPHVADEEYLANVGREIACVVRRLRHHPSIVLWCGNNEQESSMPGWCARFPAVGWGDLAKIFYEAIPARLPHPTTRTGPTGRAVPIIPWTESKTPTPRPHPATPTCGTSGTTNNRRLVRPQSRLPIRQRVRPPVVAAARDDPFLYGAPDRYFTSRVLDLHNKGGKKSTETRTAGT